MMLLSVASMCIRVSEGRINRIDRLIRRQSLKTTYQEVLRIYVGRKAKSVADQAVTNAP